VTAAGYAGMIGTLAFVLGLVLLVAKLAKRFLPGAMQASGGDAFSVVQRIPLGQRQGIAIVQRGDTLIGVSVGEGGVRMLFTVPAVVDVAVRSSSEAVPNIVPTVVSLPIANDQSFRTTGSLTPPEALRSWGDTAERETVTSTLSADQRFRQALAHAVRGKAVIVGALVVLLSLGAHASTASAQAAAPAPLQTPASRTTPPLAATQPAPTRPSTTPALRTLPPAAAQPGPRDISLRTAPDVRAPRPGTPAQTPTRSGGPATVAPLVPASQAKDIAALQQRANGNTPLTTPTAQQIATRADSMLSKLAPQMELKLGGSTQGEGLRMSGTVGVVIMMGLLSMLPVLLLMMTGFTRILVVLHFLKQALGTQSAPPGQLMAAMALLLSGFVMAPTLKEVNSTALEPWMAGQIEQVEMMSRAVAPFKTFMLAQVRDQDLQTFVDLADAKQPATREEVPLTILMSAFVTSELRTAFQIGFALFLPFIVIDVVVGSVLMSMGMVMLPPAMISLPFKLLLFVLVDGWSLVVTGLVQSFR
jgi:flagellar biosynthesis protein FliP